MDNQYFYYDNHEEDMAVDCDDSSEKKGSKKGMPFFTKMICGGLVFGMVASGTFTAGNMVIKKMTGSADNPSVEVETGNEKVREAKLNTVSGLNVTSSISEITQKVMPSVVSITNISVQQVQSFFGGVMEREIPTAGSGIIVSQTEEELLVLTNNHVVEGSSTLTVSFVDDESVAGVIKGTDATKDLAVVAVKLEDIKEETLNKISVAAMGDSSNLQVGEPAIAIGNALGYGQSVTTGIISALNRKLEGFDSELIQTDAAINPGNSGGALLNSAGEVVGINTIKLATETVEGMGYAIPITDAKETIFALMNRETRTKVPEEERGYLGVRGVSVTDESAERYNMPMGIYVDSIIEGSGAEKAGLKRGCIITEINGITVNSLETLQEQLSYYREGEKVTATIRTMDQEGEYSTDKVEITLGRY